MLTVSSDKMVVQFRHTMQPSSEWDRWTDCSIALCCLP